MKISTNLNETISNLKQSLPLEKSFDIITRDLYLGRTRAYWIGINGFCKTDIIQQMFSDLQNPLYTQDDIVKNISAYMNSKIGFAQLKLSSDWDLIIRSILSGPSALFIDGFDTAIIVDARTYPTRSIEEPETEKVTRGARDGFVETLLFNTNLIRRRIRSPRLTFEIKTVGTSSKTDIAVAYIEGSVNKGLLEELNKKLALLDVTSLTMGSKSLEELLVKKRWFNLLPNIQSTERPDVACSYLNEGHILVLVDNSPSVIILPCTIFQFTQSPDDYYRASFIGNYFRMVRFFCCLLSVFLIPVFLLIAAYFPDISESLRLLTTDEAKVLSPIQLIIYVFVVEFILDLFKYASAHSSNNYSGSFALIGGLIIGEIAVELNWASKEILFYAAITLLASLSLSSIDFSDALRIYRLFLVATTAFFGLWGFIIGLMLIIISVATTPTFGKTSYFWPLFPLNRNALKALLFRYPAAKAQSSTVGCKKAQRPH